MDAKSSGNFSEKQDICVIFDFSQTAYYMPREGNAAKQ
jgi:hypothetical protein